MSIKQVNVFSYQTTDQITRHEQLVSELKKWDQWDDIDDQGFSGGTTFMKYFNPDNHNKYVYLTIGGNSSSYGPYVRIGCINDTGNLNAAFGDATGMKQTQANCRVIITDDGILYVSTQASTGVKTFENGCTIGVYKSKNAITGAESWCSFGDWALAQNQVVSIRGAIIFGESTTSSQVAVSTCSAARAIGINSKLYSVLPYTYANSADIPMNVYGLCSVPDVGLDADVEVIFNNKLYRRFRDVLIPV